MAKVIMVQGTMSNAGKSLVTAGLCRVFMQDGYKVAPFKSQNMALNSFITKEGLEMGRAQVMQAEACGIEPSVNMNPILLKPTNDVGSQVIVNGEVLGNMSARDYYKRKKELIPHIMKAYNELDKEYDIIVMEGAGSPAEINLKDNDIVNMGMAKLVNSPVLLVGDIDRGGVFASIAGTLLLLDDDEKDMIKGTIINKFRGDVNILKPGLDMIEDITKKPVVGVIPYMQLDIDDEDSLCEKYKNTSVVDVIDIAVIRLPRISNFTDFNVFEYIPGVSLRYVRSVKDLKNPDMIIIPGTKNTMDDLRWLRETGLEAMILKHAAKGKVVFGICGGYQMLGMELADPLGVEGGGTLAGMGLLPTKTVFEEAKVRTRVSGNFNNVEGILEDLSYVEFEGYEIHMGQTIYDPNGCELTTIDNVNGEDIIKNDGLYQENVYGSYIHGIFDKEEVSKAIVEGLCKHKGIDYSKISTVNIEKYKEEQYDKLADGIRNSLDMKAIYEILNQGV